MENKIDGGDRLDINWHECVLNFLAYDSKGNLPPFFFCIPTIMINNKQGVPGILAETGCNSNPIYNF